MQKNQLGIVVARQELGALRCVAAPIGKIDRHENTGHFQRNWCCGQR